MISKLDKLRNILFVSLPILFFLVIAVATFHKAEKMQPKYGTLIKLTNPQTVVEEPCVKTSAMNLP